MSAALPRVHGVPRLPVPPGQSAFRMKGSLYANLLLRVAREVPDGAARLRAALPDPALVRFIDQIFLSSAWYDALPMVPLLATSAHLKGISFEQETSHAARLRVTEDINGVYRLIFRLASPDLVAPRLSRAFGKYLDFGRAESTTARPGEVTITARGMPEFLASWYVQASGAFFRVALELSGARDATVAWQPPEPAGHLGALPLLVLRARVEWR
ncbi:hypothetical protein WME91_09740 [Sorangium sp. So ce269]